MQRAVADEFGRGSDTEPGPSARPVALARSGPDEPVAAEPAKTVRLGRAVSAVGWALSGFLVGAAFWHFVGFWSFLSSVVLKGPEARPRLERYVLVEGRPATPELVAAVAVQGPADAMSTKPFQAGLVTEGAVVASLEPRAGTPPGALGSSDCILLVAAGAGTRAEPCPLASEDPMQAPTAVAKADRETPALVSTWAATVASPPPTSSTGRPQPTR